MYSDIGGTMVGSARVRTLSACKSLTTCSHQIGLTIPLWVWPASVIARKLDLYYCASISPEYARTLQMSRRDVQGSYMPPQLPPGNAPTRTIQLVVCEQQFRSRKDTAPTQRPMNEGTLRGKKNRNTSLRRLSPCESRCVRVFRKGLAAVALRPTRLRRGESHLSLDDADRRRWIRSRLHVTLRRRRLSPALPGMNERAHKKAGGRSWREAAGAGFAVGAGRWRGRRRPAWWECSITRSVMSTLRYALFVSGSLKSFSRPSTTSLVTTYLPPG